MTHEEMIAVIKAQSEGKTIESRTVGAHEWVPLTAPIWNFAFAEYRIKPAEPVKRKLIAIVSKSTGELQYRWEGIKVDSNYFFHAPELDKEITLPAEV